MDRASRRSYSEGERREGETSAASRAVVRPPAISVALLSPEPRLAPLADEGDIGLAQQARFKLYKPSGRRRVPTSTALWWASGESSKSSSSVQPAMPSSAYGVAAGHMGAHRLAGGAGGVVYGQRPVKGIEEQFGVHGVSST
eukprot:scaffold13663_cov120-Isochrysis_galbana.AAC.2